jgi:hypothetical protein
MELKQTERFETLAYKIQTPRDHPEKKAYNIQNKPEVSNHG